MSKTRKINKTVLLLTLTDVFSWGPFYIISTISGIYLANKLGEDTVQFIGIGTAIYYVTRSIFQIPIGYITDKLKTTTDEMVMLCLGVILMGIPYILYPQISLPIHYYILQFVFGVGSSLNLTTWRKLFALNIDKGKEGSQYAFYEAATSLSSALLATSMGYIANISERHFDIIIVLSGLVMSLACLWVICISKMKQK